MKCNFIAKQNIMKITKQFIRMLVFSVGVGILVWQSNNTFETFIAGRTTFVRSTQTFDYLSPPTVVICQNKIWKNGIFANENVNISDTDWFFNQFDKLNDKMNITHSFSNGYQYSYQNLSLGNNWLDQIVDKLHVSNEKITANLSIRVTEFLNPWVGLCYAMIPGPKMKMANKDSQLMWVKFSQEIENPTMSVYLLSEKDLHGLLLPDFGRLKPLKIQSLGLKTQTWIAIERRISNYLPLKRNCTDESYMKCQLKNNIECFKKNSPKFNCTCVPKNTYKSYFEIYPINNLDECNTNAEYSLCNQIMDRCSFGLSAKCQPPCEKEEYRGELIEFYGHGMLNKDGIMIQMAFNTMDTEIYTEVWQFDLATFIGTVGGSFGLFIGFSLTGFVGQVLDYFMRDK